MDVEDKNVSLSVLGSVTSMAEADSKQSDEDLGEVISSSPHLSAKSPDTKHSKSESSHPDYYGDDDDDDDNDLDQSMLPHSVNSLKSQEDDASVRSEVKSFTKKNGICYTDVVIVGNGPSGICLSYFLSGHWPYYTGSNHPNEMIQMRLEDCPTDVSLVEMDLDYLSYGLEGRSTNPLAVLFDALTHPEADVGLEMKSLLRWEYHKDKVIPHVVLGKRASGGTWQTLKSDMQTLSLGSWMELPDLPIKDWLAEFRSAKQKAEDDYVPPPVHNRASMTEICAYYSDYVIRKSLAGFVQNYSTVTSVERVLDVTHAVDSESGEQNPCSHDHRGKVKWEVRGYQVVKDGLGQQQTVDFCYRAPNVVLATGAYDVPNKLGVPGEGLSYVLHSLVELEAVTRSGNPAAWSDPVMVVGAGLSAADVILFAERLGVPVAHVFRRHVDDPRIVLRQLPAALYPEYHHVLRMMSGEMVDERYASYPRHEVIQCLEDGKVIIRGPDAGCDSLIRVSYVVVLVGSRPDLSFLPHDGSNLGVVPGLPIDAKNNPILIDPASFESVHESGLFALGPLVGDNFVRFLPGGALGVTSHLWRKRKTGQSMET